MRDFKDLKFGRSRVQIVCWGSEIAEEFGPHWQVGSSWFREKLSPANRNKGYRGEQISRKIVSRELNARSYRDFAKNIALLGATSAKFAKSVGKKMGSNMRLQYIQFRDIHDRDISGLHCTQALPPTTHTGGTRGCVEQGPQWHHMAT